jgi:hypothetical protein
MPRRTSYLALAVVLCGAACTREVPRVKQDEDPPPVTLRAEPPPTGLPPFTPSATPHVAAPSAAGRRVGDHVSVRWHGTCYAARILGVPSPGSYLITYDGYGHSWDETVGENRICK